MTDLTADIFESNVQINKILGHPPKTIVVYNCFRTRIAPQPCEHLTRTVSNGKTYGTNVKRKTSASENA
ncbi:hypothetical protein P5673_001317 [Acropora cervicornis]|uniref:Uncharacterized protein n=1 Tax=Acropora cervicornis TaxID=6130 RepID=A0AAD9R676_ACRCE|nr:hypothetical protein P5673_001317 [Acropora cervicornis]